MRLCLVSIQFHCRANHGLTLPLAKLKNPVPPCPKDELPSNDSVPVDLPEWRASASKSAKDSPVAFCIARTAEAKPVIEVVLESSGANCEIEIRAHDGSGGGNILGVPGPRVIEFDSTCRANVELPLPQARFTAVAVHNDIWLWQWRERGKAWEDLARTDHRIYVTLDAPNSRWSVEECHQYPWIEALDVSAGWASGARDVDDAASRITRGVFALGQASSEHPQFTYLSPSFTDDNGFEDSHFDCASFLGALAGCDSLPTVVDCSDTAAIVATFTNILGGRLIRSVFGADFVTRPICPIGQTEFVHLQFGFHEIAWKGAATTEGRVWDACLLVCRGSNPDYHPHAGVNCTGWKLGEYLENEYFWRLVAPDCANFEVKKAILLSGNRTLGSVHPRRPPGGQPTPSHAASSENWFYWNLQGVELDGLSWQTQRTTPVLLDPGLFAVDAMFLAGSAKVQVKTEVCPAAAIARAHLAHRRAAIASLMTPAPFGDGGFANPAHTSIIFTRGNLFAEFRIAGPLERRLDDAVHLFDKMLTDRSSTFPKSVVAATHPVDVSSLLNTGLDGKSWYRVYSPDGQIQVRRGKPVYLGYRSGPQDLTFFTYDSAGQVSLAKNI